MDRRQYLAALAAIGGAGCVSNETTPDPDPPPGEFQAIADPELWEYELPTDRHRLAIDSGVYVASEETLTRLSTTGAVQWTIDSPSAYRSDLAATEDAVYHITSNTLESYDPVSGGQRWSNRIPAVGILSVSNMTEEGVFVSETTDDPSASLPVLAFDAESGEERWRTETGMNMGSAISHGLWLIVSVVDGVTALDTATGDIEWERSPGTDYDSTLRVVGDTVCVITNDTVTGYSLPDGTSLWEQSLPADAQFSAQSPPESATVGTLYIADEESNLTALNATTGDEQWGVNTNWGDDGYEGMTFEEDSVIYHSGTALASYDAVDGTQQWEYSLGSEYKASQPLIADGTVFLIVQESGEKASMKTFDLETGRRQWRTELQTDLPRIRAILDQHIVFTTDEEVYGLPMSA
jgi:outer membrane protein assembly factor BamB